MNNVVTPETAAQLKATGFPQPEPEAGQVWYNEYGETVFVVKAYKYKKHLRVSYIWEDRLQESAYPNPDFNTLAHTATDILRELDHTYEFWFSKLGTYFACRVNKGIDYVDDNPAEVCAAAWLAKQQKQ